MANVMLKATRPFEYARKKLKPGEVFAASLQDARILVGLRRAVRCEEEETTDVDVRLIDKPSDGEGRQKRRYRRRDMTAE
jgi:hypothetical protein